MICRLIKFEKDEDIVRYLFNLDVDAAGINIMKNKLNYYNIEINELRAPAAIILKQEALSCGAELAIPKECIIEEDKTKKFTTLLMCNLKQLNILIKKIKKQQFGLDIVANELLALVAHIEKYWMFTNHSFNFSQNNFVLMGIINITPDSFYDGGKYNETLTDALNYAEKLIKDGADILDIGGESTRPGAEPITEEEEINRVIPILKELKKNFANIPISIDSTKYNVIKRALDNGADIVNDISGLSKDINIADLTAEYKAGLCLMHKQGEPMNMQDNPNYKNLIKEIMIYLLEAIEKAVSKGVNKNSIVIDPGIGFGKTVEHNLEIIKRLNEFSSLNRPILIGVSNKSFIGKILNLEISERVIGTAAANVNAYINGARIFRVHNIKENKQALELTKKIMNVKILN
ncbi:MAG TPA: dihydropteroate synthase [bacterium]|nr:dihydropteroate synthase [bacterium]